MNFSSKRLIKIIISILSGVMFYAMPGAGYTANTFSFGIVPQQAASKLASTWGPILKHLETQSGYKLNFATAKNIPVFEENLENGTYDFVYMNPHHYVVYHKHNGYKAIAKAKDKKIHGIIVVHKNSKINNIQDLHNKEIAFPSPLAFAASLVVKNELSRAKVLITSRYVLSHDSVYRNVAAGNFIAGGGVVRTYMATDKDVRKDLRILYKTKGYTPHALAVHPRVSAKVVRSVLQAMLDMANTDSGKKLLNELKIKGIEKAKDRDWDDVRKIQY